MNSTKSSFPDIFKATSKKRTIIQKQQKQFSLYLRSNSFDFNRTNILQDLRYNTNNKKIHHTIRTRQNHSLNSIYVKNKTRNQNQSKLVFRLSSRNSNAKTHFIQQKQVENAQQMESFKTVRKNTTQQLTLAFKALQAASQQEERLHQDLDKVKKQYLDNLNSLNFIFLQKIYDLDKTLKVFRRETSNQQKAIKKQFQFLKEELQVTKSIFVNFQIQKDKIMFELTSKK